MDPPHTGSAESEADLRIGGDAFKAEESFESVTSESQSEPCEPNSRRVTMIDTPGLFDTELSNEEIKRASERINHCISMMLPKLLEKINNSVEANGESLYSCKMFREMEREIREEQMKTLMERVREKEEEMKIQMDRVREKEEEMNILLDRVQEKEEDMKILMKDMNREREEEMKVLMEEMNREREEDVKTLEEEKESMNILMEEMNREREEEIKTLEEEKNRLKMEMKLMVEEQQNQEKDRKRREEELNRERREEEKHQRDLQDKMRQEQEKSTQEIEEMRREREKLQLKYDTEREQLMKRTKNERENYDEERKRREEEFKEKEEQYKIQIKEKEEKTQEICEKMKREWEKQKLEEKTRGEQIEEKREREKQISDGQIQKLQSEMERIKREKEKIEREKEEQLEGLEKRLEEEKDLKEDQEKTFEEKLKLCEEQHDDELKRRRVEWREEYEREKEEMKKICSETDASLQFTAYSKLTTEYSKWTWSLRRAIMETQNKLHNRIENEEIHKVEETDLQKELKETGEEVEKSMSEFFEKDKDKDILIQWKTSLKIKIKEIQENIVRETRRKLNEILQQRDLKKNIIAQRTHHESMLYEKSKELALNLEDGTSDEETLKREFDLFWEQSESMIIRDTPVIRNIDLMGDAKNLIRDVYKYIHVDNWREGTDIFSASSYRHYIQLEELSEFIWFTQCFGNNLSKEEVDNTHRSLVSDVVLQTDRMIQSFNISEMGYNNISCIKQLTSYIKTRITEHQEGPVKYVFKDKFLMDLVFFICKRANRTITDQHRLFRETNDPLLYLEKKREEYYSIFQKYCQRSTSTDIFGEILCQKLKEPIEQSVYRKMALDVTDEMRSNFESLNGNRSNLEKHILKTLAEEEDFDKYMNYIHNPRDHFKSFIRDEVSRYISDKFSVSVVPKMKENIELLQQKILTAAHESTEHVQLNSGDVHLWMKSFTQKLSDELIFSERDLSGVTHDDVEDLNLLEDVMRKKLPFIMSDISRRFNTKTFPSKLDFKFRPDELLINHFSQCCWAQCPFCKAICTNTIENHDGNHSVPLHRVTAVNGTYFKCTQNLCVDTCQNFVAYGLNCETLKGNLVWKEMKIAGPKSAIWSITSDRSLLTYWKWFVCRFQKDLEGYYSKTFEEKGKIPDQWRNYSKQEAFISLDQYI